jgi:type III secretion system HrpB4-like protein
MKNGFSAAMGGAANTAQTLPFRRAAAVLAAWQCNADTALDWADPSWTAALLRLSAAQVECMRDTLHQASDAARAVCSRSLLHAACVRPPRFDQLAQPALVRHAGHERHVGLGQPNAALLDALPAERGLQVLRMRALLFRRAELRHLIDKRTRQQLSEWVGVSADRLTQDVHAGEPPDTARLIARAEMPPLVALDAARLAIEGYALLLRDLARAATPELVHPQANSLPPYGKNETQRPARDALAVVAPAAPRVPVLLRLALPRVLPPVQWLAAVPDELDARASANLFARLAELLPEFAWLSG